MWRPCPLHPLAFPSPSPTTQPRGHWAPQPLPHPFPSHAPFLLLFMANASQMLSDVTSSRHPSASFLNPFEAGLAPTETALVKVRMVATLLIPMASHQFFSLWPTTSAVCHSPRAPGALYFGF